MMWEFWIHVMDWLRRRKRIPSPVSVELLPKQGHRHYHRVRGFTLTEVMMVTVILGILAGMAVPVYVKSMERGYWQSAQDVLMTIYAGEKNYAFTHNGVYQDLTPASPPADWQAIKMDNPNMGSIPITYEVFADPNPPGRGAQFGDTGFSAVATHNSNTMRVAGDRAWCGDGNITHGAFDACQGSWPYQ